MTIEILVIEWGNKELLKQDYGKLTTAQESFKECKEVNKEANKAISKAWGKHIYSLYQSSDTKRGEKNV